MSEKFTTQEAAAKTEGWYRPGVAIKPDLEHGLKRFITLSGATGLSPLFTALASDPERAAALIAPVVEEFRLKQESETGPKKERKKQLDEVNRLVKSGLISTKELERLIAAASASGV